MSNYLARLVEEKEQTQPVVEGLARSITQFNKVTGHSLP